MRLFPGTDCEYDDGYYGEFEEPEPEFEEPEPEFEAIAETTTGRFSAPFSKTTECPV